MFDITYFLIYLYSDCQKMVYMYKYIKILQGLNIMVELYIHLILLLNLVRSMVIQSSFNNMSHCILENKVNNHNLYSH